jgi:hypothetical protein
MEPSRPPKEIGPRGRALWRAVTARYELTPTELELLRELCCATDELGRLVTVSKNVRTTIPGSRGQDIMHPVFAELRYHRENVRRLFVALALPDNQHNQRPRVLKSKGGLPTALRAQTRRAGGTNVANS